MTYKERIQDLAEKMAGSPLEELFHIWKAVYETTASTGVDEIAEEVKIALIKYGHSLDSIQEYLLAKGLIEQEAKTNE